MRYIARNRKKFNNLKEGKIKIININPYAVITSVA